MTSPSLAKNCNLSLLPTLPVLHSLRNKHISIIVQYSIQFLYFAPVLFSWDQYQPIGCKVLHTFFFYFSGLTENSNVKSTLCDSPLKFSGSSNKLHLKNNMTYCLKKLKIISNHIISALVCHCTHLLLTGRTRVMISGGGVVGGGGSTDPPTSLSPEPLKVTPSTVTLRSTSGSTAARPQSMFGGRSFSLSPSPSSPDTITVSHKQWLELNEKVSTLLEVLYLNNVHSTL